jgi:antirestriction protein ArdC
MRVSPDCFPSSTPGRDRQRGTAMIYAGRFIPTATAGAQPTGDEATAIPFLKRFTSPIPSTVKICDRYPEHLAR